MGIEDAIGYFGLDRQLWKNTLFAAGRQWVSPGDLVENPFTVDVIAAVRRELGIFRLEPGMIALGPGWEEPAPVVIPQRKIMARVRITPEAMLASAYELAELEADVEEVLNRSTVPIWKMPEPPWETRPPAPDVDGRRLQEIDARDAYDWPMERRREVTFWNGSEWMLWSYVNAVWQPLRVQLGVVPPSSVVQVPPAVIVLCPPRLYSDAD